MLIGMEKIQLELSNLPDNCPHFLLSGRWGSGKSASAFDFAEKKHKKLIILTGHTTTKTDIIKTLLSLKGGELILIDEIQRLDIKAEECLYLPMEKYILPLNSLSGENIIVNIPYFTIIGTTTESNRLSKPLRSRFILHFQVPDYTLDNLQAIIKDKYKELDDNCCKVIAEHINTPREAINLAQRITLLKMNTDKALLFLGYKYGLSKEERKYLRVVEERKRLSLTSLQWVLQLDKNEILKIEDRLIHKGLIEIKSNGRFLTESGEKFVNTIKKGGSNE